MDPDQATLQLVIEHVHDVVWILDAGTLNFTFINPVVQTLLGYSPEEALQLGPRGLAPTRSMEATLAELAQLASLPRALAARRANDRRAIEYRHRGGHSVWGDLSLTFIDSPASGLGVVGVTRAIADRGPREIMERSNLQRCHDIFDLAPIAVLIVVQGQIAYLNRHAVELFGLEKSESWIGRSIVTLIHPDDRSRVEQLCTPLIDSAGSSPEAEIVFLRADHQRIAVGVSIANLPFEPGLAKVVFARDLTVQRATSARLSEREALLNSIYRVAPAAIGVVSQRIIDEANPMLGRVLGYDVEDLRRMATQRLYSTPAEYQRVGQTLDQQIATDGVGTLRTQWLHKDGRPIEIALSATQLHPEQVDGTTVFVALDVTEQTRVQRTLEANESELHAIYEGAPVMMLLLDEQGRCRRLNGRAKTFLGINDDAALGRQLGDLLGCIHSSDASAEISGTPCEHCILFHALRRAGEGTTTQRAELVLETKRDGIVRSFVLLVSTTPLRIAGDPRTLLCIEDITQHKALAEQYRQSQKLDALGQLAGGVAHDFNTILFALTLHLGLMQNYPGLTAQLRQELSDLEAEAQFGANLSRQLLLFSRHQTLSLTQVNLDVTITQALKVLRKLLQPEIRVVPIPPKGTATVMGDASMLEQMVVNLCLNARDAMPHGGTLTLRTRFLQCDAAAHGTPPKLRTGAFIVLSVADTGCGMDPATLERIFQPFFTTKGPDRGTGLGLATVRAIVDRHQGWIDVRSKPGAGTVFEIALPACPASVSPS